MHPEAGSSSSRPGTHRHQTGSLRGMSDAELRLQAALLTRNELLALGQAMEKSKVKKCEILVEEIENVAPKKIDEPTPAFPADDCVDFSCLYAQSEYGRHFNFDTEETEFTSGIELVLSPFNFDDEPPQTIPPPPPQASPAKTTTSSRTAVSTSAAAAPRNAVTKKIIVLPREYALEDVYGLDYTEDSDESIISVDSMED